MLMQRRVLLFLGVLLCVPALAQAAITITAGNHILLQNTAGQDVNILLSGAGGSDFYASSDMRTLIGGGTSGPVVTHVFGDTGAIISPASLMNASVWADAGTAQGGINLTPDGTSPTDSGRRTAGGFATAGFANVTANGIYATLTLDTTGVAPGVYSFNLTGHPNGDTEIFFFDDVELFDVVLIDTAVLVNGTLTVVPEPASVVFGLTAMAGLAVVAIRRSRKRRAA